MDDNYNAWKDVVLNLAGSIICNNKEEAIAEWLEEIRKSPKNLDTRFMVTLVLTPDSEIIDECDW